MTKYFLGVMLAAAIWQQPAGAAEGRKERIARLQHAVLAPCCSQEAVATHQSEVALKMRLEIERWADQGRSDEDILGRYAREYGAKVLVDPNTRPQPWSFITPWALTALATLGVSGMIWRWRRTGALPLPGAFVPGDTPLPDIDDEG